MESLETMAKEDIKNSFCKKTTDTTLHDRKLFQHFEYRNFKDYKNFEKMRPISNHPSRLYAFAKIHKIVNVNEVNLDQLKL